MKQKRLIPKHLNEEKIYVNAPQNKVIIWKDKQKTEVDRIISLKHFKTLVKRAPHLNWITIIFAL